MTLPLRTFCAAVAVFALPLFSSAGVIKSAGTASTSSTSTTTTTSGQRTILNNIDPYNVASFQLDVSFEADKVQFVGITGLNNYIVDDFQIHIDGNMGIIDNIHGYFPGFNDRGGLELDGPITNGVPTPPAPPPGEIDIFQVKFLDLRPDLDKLFGVFAGGPDDYMTGFDPATGGFTNAVGPFNGQTGVQPAFSVVPGIPNGGGNPVPLPPAIWIGLLGGAGVIGNAMRLRRAA